MSEEKRVFFARNLKAGPHGVGDPNDKSLRKVEKDILIPQKMRDKARTEKCIKEVEDFSVCCKNSSFLMVFKCREVNNALKACLETWFNDPKFKEECTEEYLRERTQYRKTGIPVRSKNARVLSST